MSMFPKAVSGVAILLLANQAFAQYPPPAAPAPGPAAPGAQQPAPPPAQYPQQPGAQPQYPQQQYPQQPGAQPQYPQQQYPQQQPAGQYPQQQYPQQQQQNMQLQPGAAEPVVAAEPGPKIKTFSFVPRLGLQLGGSGTRKAESPGGSASQDFSVSMAAAISLDFMFKIGSLFRIGPGLLYTHTMDVKDDVPGATSVEMGTITDFDVVAEVVPKVGGSVWLLPRMDMGLSMYNASGVAADSETANQQGCESYGINGCSSYKSPHIGFNIGPSFGVMFAAGNTVRVRFDTSLRYYSINLASLDSGGQTATLTGSGIRYFLLGGIEI
jgi:hypothetical protein